VAKQLNWGLGSLTVEVSRSREIIHSHTLPVRFLWTRDQLVAEAATYKKHNKHKRGKYTPSAGFEPMIGEMKRLQTKALEGTTTGSGLCTYMQDNKLRKTSVFTSAAVKTPGPSKADFHC
jgi:hypothetical protein